jgi:serine/threonine-protein kinase RsbW
MSETRQTQSRLQVTIDSRLPEIDAVCERTKEFLGERGLTKVIFEIILVVREALLNAVVHGNKEDPAKKVFFDLCIEDGHLVVRVQDEGEGFDAGSLVFSPAPVDQNHGRGLFIMKEYSTELRFNEKGNALTLRKSLHAGRTAMTQVDVEGDKVVVRPGRDIVASMVEELRAEILSVLGKNPAGLAIDMAGVEMIDSVGIGLLIAAHNSLSKKSAVLELRNVSADIQNLFRTMRLERHFAIVK